MLHISRDVRLLIRKALREDIGRGDITTDLFVPSSLRGKARIHLKSKGVLCGAPVARDVFRAVDPKLKVTQTLREGSRVSKFRQVMEIRGRFSSILKAERVALNFLAHLSGIATLTNRFVKRVKGTRAKIFDTRKTTPLWRELEKYAVRTGSGSNHRLGLWDEVLVKDNHWKAIRAALRGVPKGRRSTFGEERQVLPEKYSRKSARCNLRDCFAALAMTAWRKRIPVEIEVDNIRELQHLLSGRVRLNRILLDNFSISELKKAVRLIRHFNFRQNDRRIRRGSWRAKIEIEASGGINLANVRQVAKTGIDRISIGALTHSAPALDFSLSIE